MQAGCTIVNMQRGLCLRPWRCPGEFLNGDLGDEVLNEEWKHELAVQGPLQQGGCAAAGLQQQ